MNKNDKVKIISKREPWSGLTGKVISVLEDEEIVSVKLKFEIDGDIKYVIQDFKYDEVELLQENESLNEEFDMNTISNFLKYYNVMSEEEFNDMLHGLKIYDYQLDIAGLENETAVKGLIAKPEYMEILWEEELSELIVSNLGYVYSIPPQDPYTGLRLYRETIDSIEEFLKSNMSYFEPIRESLKKDDEEDEDFIYDYVYFTDEEDKEIPCWCFASKIAAAEGNLNIEYVIDAAIKHKYKVFYIDAPGFFKQVIAAKDLTVQDIEEDYADYLQGNAKVIEVA